MPGRFLCWKSAAFLRLISVSSHSTKTQSVQSSSGKPYQSSVSGGQSQSCIARPAHTHRPAEPSSSLSQSRGGVKRGVSSMITSQNILLHSAWNLAICVQFILAADASKLKRSVAFIIAQPFECDTQGRFDFGFRCIQVVEILFICTLIRFAKVERNSGGIVARKEANEVSAIMTVLHSMMRWLKFSWFCLALLFTQQKNKIFSKIPLAFFADL